MLTALAIGTFVLLLGLGPAYLWVLAYSCRHSKAKRMPPDAPPQVDIIVPIYNEAALIESKIAALKQLDYPRSRYRVILVDGCSTDGTLQLVRSAIGQASNFALITTKVSGKIAQLNAALVKTRAPWIMITDADAHLPSSTLKVLFAEIAAQPSLHAIGTAVRPETCLWLERYHWFLSNALRSLESRCGSASFVTGPCYLFQRSLLETFPADVIADDIHVALCAHSKGERVGFCRLRVRERRAPSSIAGLWRHKLRKAQAYLREVFRFLRSTADPRATRHIALYCRMAQLVLAPLMGMTAVLLCAAAVITGLQWPTLLILTLLLVAITISPIRRGPVSAAAYLILAGFTAVILLAAMLSYPFTVQDACYGRVT